MSGSAPAFHDIRLQGFSDRASLSAAWAWLDAQLTLSGTEVVALAYAIGRISAAPVTSSHMLPATDQATADGYAVRGADCDGASTYNPLTLELSESGAARLDIGQACPIAAGCELPAGADSILPFEAAQHDGANRLVVLDSVAPGNGIRRRAEELRGGATPLPGQKKLRPQDVACLALLGLGDIEVMRRPRVKLLVPGPKSGFDALTPLLSVLLARDGASVDAEAHDNLSEAALVAMLHRAGRQDYDLILIAGRSGAGPDDIAALALYAAGGVLDLHGVALQPGGSAGLGRLAQGMPVVLLPGDPSGCLASYDMLASRLVRRFSGADCHPAYATVNLELGRKIASEIGTSEIVPVRVAGMRALPISFDSGLIAAIEADGFIIIPASREGYPATARVCVHLYDSLSGAGQAYHG